jgi:hypothetical protein
MKYSENEKMKNKKVLTIAAVVILVFVILFVSVILPEIKNIQKILNGGQSYDVCYNRCKPDIVKFSPIINIDKLNLSNCGFSSSSGERSYSHICSYNVSNTISLRYGRAYSTMMGDEYSYKLNISEPFKHKELFNDSFVSLFPECWDGKEEGCKERICEHIYSAQEKECIGSWSCNTSIDSSGHEYLYAEFSHRTR